LYTEIKLNIDLKIVKALFYEQGYHRLFYGLYNKKQSIILLIGLILFPFYLYYSLEYDIRWLLVVGIFIYYKIIDEFWLATKSVYRWRKSAFKFLKAAKKVKEIIIKYDDIHFIHIQDGNEIKLEWLEIKKANVNENSIQLFFTGNILYTTKIHERGRISKSS
jgi:hypothetical protein